MLSRLVQVQGRQIGSSSLQCIAYEKGWLLALCTGISISRIHCQMESCMFCRRRSLDDLLADGTSAANNTSAVKCCP